MSAVLAALLAVSLIAFVLVQVFSALPKGASPAPTTTPATTVPAATLAAAGGAGTLTALSGAPLSVIPVITPGGQGHLLQPREAVVSFGHLIYVAGPGSHAVMVFNRAGKYVRSIKTAAHITLKAPTSLVAGVNNHLYILDAALGHVVDYIGPHAWFVRKIGNGLPGAFGSTIGRDGHDNILVANAALNSVTVFNAHGKLVSRHAKPVGAALGQLNQPSNVAGGPNGSIYVLDNANQRVQKFTGTWLPKAQWPAPPSDTSHTAHIVVLEPQRFLVSDPSGSVLDYDTSVTPAVVRRRGFSGNLAISPLGLAPLDKSHLLVTDAHNHAVWSVTLP